MFSSVCSGEQYRWFDQEHAGDAGEGPEDRGAPGVDGERAHWGGGAVCCPLRGVAELTQTGSLKYVTILS